MLNDHLSLFNRKGSEYKKLVYDTTQIEKENVRAPNDINKGAMHNAHTWHYRNGQNIATRMSLRQSKGYLTEIWAEFLGH